MTKNINISYRKGHVELNLSKYILINLFYNPIYCQLLLFLLATQPF